MSVHRCIPCCSRQYLCRYIDEFCKRDFRVTMFLDRNLVLSEQDRPNHDGTFCDEPVLFATSTGELAERELRGYLWHFSRFLFPALCASASAGILRPLKPPPSKPGKQITVVLPNRAAQPLTCI